jgi:hypothetical protein
MKEPLDRDVPIADGVLFVTRLNSKAIEIPLKEIENVEVQKDLAWARAGVLAASVLGIVYWAPFAFDSSDPDRAMGSWIFLGLTVLLALGCFRSWWAVAVLHKGTYYKFKRGSGYDYATSVKDYVLRNVMDARKL